MIKEREARAKRLVSVYPIVSSVVTALVTVLLAALAVMNFWLGHHMGWGDHAIIGGLSLFSFC